MPADALEVFHRLESRGWKSQYFRPRAISERFLRFRHAMDFAAPSGGFIDLHWHVLHLYCHDKADALFWSDSEKFQFCGMEAETCGATGHLLQICTHGIVWSPVPPVRWVADAVLLLRSGRAVDWKILVNACAEWDIVPFVLQALAPLAGRRLAGASRSRLPPPPAVRFRTRESVGAARPAREIGDAQTRAKVRVMSSGAGARAGRGLLWLSPCGGRGRAGARSLRSSPGGCRRW